MFKTELTDTFNGQANYSWVNREALDLPDDISDRILIRETKRKHGLTGAIHIKENVGDSISLDFPGHCFCLFIDWIEG